MCSQRVEKITSVYDVLSELGKAQMVSSPMGADPCIIEEHKALAIQLGKRLLANKPGPDAPQVYHEEFATQALIIRAMCRGIIAWDAMAGSCERLESKIKELKK